MLTLLRQGEASPEFRNALRFVDDFIASTQPATDAQSRQTLRQMLPGIERSLRRGLANVAFQEQDVERLLGQLHAYYRQQLGETLDESEVVTVDEDAAMLAIPDSIQPIIDETPTPQRTMILEEETVEVPHGRSARGTRSRHCSPAPGWSSALPDEPMSGPSCPGSAR